MKIVYLYTALTTVGGADRIIIQKANYLADVMGHEVYIVTDSQAGRAVVFPLSSKVSILTWASTSTDNTVMVCCSEVFTTSHSCLFTEENSADCWNA